MKNAAAVAERKLILLMAACVASIFCLEKENNQKANLLNERVCISLAVVQNTAFSGIPWKRDKELVKRQKYDGIHHSDGDYCCKRQEKPHYNRFYVSSKIWGSIFKKRKALTFLQDVP